MWIQHNLHERLKNKHSKYRINFIPQKFKVMEFDDAAEYTANLIYDKFKNLYIGLSGGIDSEYVVHLFHRLNIPFRPIIVKTPFNSLEIQYAFHTCRMLNIEPIILECTENLFLAVYKKYILEKFNGIGQNSTTSIISARYTEKNNGIFIIGDHLLNEHESLFLENDIISHVSSSEWDFYLDVLFPEKSISFFTYTPELTYAMVKRIDFTLIPEFKSSLYKLPFRPKIYYQYFETVLKKIRDMRKEFDSDKDYNTHDFSKEEFLLMMDSWNV